MFTDEPANETVTNLGLVAGFLLCEAAGRVGQRMEMELDVWTPTSVTTC